MVRMVFAGLLALLLAACGDSGKDFQLTSDQTYQRLRGLDLGAKIDSATFIFPKHTSTVGEDGKSVTWRFKGKDIMIARLTPKSEDVTNVALELPQMKEGGGIMASGLAHKLMSERVASHLERRPFNDKEIMDALYAGSMVPADIQAMALEAQREYASMTRELDEDRDRDYNDPYEARRQMKSASAPTTDLSAYERR